jgi:hypothetical protein
LLNEDLESLKVELSDLRPEVRIATLHAIGRFQLTSQQHASVAIQSLSAPNIVKEALKVVSELGPDVVQRALSKIKDISDHYPDSQVRDLASRIRASGLPQ